MGQLVDGVWHDTWYDTKSTGGRFKRSVSAFRNWLTADGAGPKRRSRVRCGKRPLPSVRFSGLPMGASHPDPAQPERTGAVYFRLRGQPPDVRERLDFRR